MAWNEHAVVLQSLVEGNGWFIRQEHRDAAEVALRKIASLNTDVRGLKEHRDGVTKLTKENETLRALVKSLESERNGLREDGNKKTVLQNRLDKLEADYRALFNSGESLQSENLHLREQLTEALAQLEELRSLRQEADEEYAAHSETLKLLDEEEVKTREAANAERDLSEKYSRLTDELNREREERDKAEAQVQTAQEAEQQAAVRAVLAEGKYNELYANVIVAVNHLKTSLEK